MYPDMDKITTLGAYYRTARRDTHIHGEDDAVIEMN